jgi:T-complex protein 1 subunit delta
VQDVVAGDGTTSVVVICGALLKKAQELLEKGIHPTVISDSFNKAANKACEVRCQASHPYIITPSSSMSSSSSSSSHISATASQSDMHCLLVCGPYVMG